MHKFILNMTIPAILLLGESNSVYGEINNLDKIYTIENDIEVKDNKELLKLLEDIKSKNKIINNKKIIVKDKLLKNITKDIETITINQEYIDSIEKKKIEKEQVKPKPPSPEENTNNKEIKKEKVENQVKKEYNNNEVTNNYTVQEVSYPLNSLTINGVSYPIVVGGQERVDMNLKEFVNVGYYSGVQSGDGGVEYKTHYDGKSIWLAAESTGVGALVYNTESLIFTDINGVSRKYQYIGQTRTLYGGQIPPDDIWEVLMGRGGDYIVIQTCDPDSYGRGIARGYFYEIVN